MKIFTPDSPLDERHDATGEKVGQPLMDKREAAAYLGISLRTLERLAAQGKLTKGRRRGKTRPAVVFDPEELKALKRKLDTQRSPELMRPSSTSRPQDALGFRIDPYYLARLTKEGAQYGLSAGEYARKLVIQGLEETREKQLMEQLTALRDGLAEMFYLLLVHKMGASEREAEALVSNILRRE